MGQRRPSHNDPSQASRSDQCKRNTEQDVDEGIRGLPLPCGAGSLGPSASDTSLSSASPLVGPSDWLQVVAHLPRRISITADRCAQPFHKSILFRCSVRGGLQSFLQVSDWKLFDADFRLRLYTSIRTTTTWTLSPVSYCGIMTPDAKKGLTYHGS